MCTKNLVKHCNKLYNEGGAGAVYDYCNEVDHQHWRDCSGCEENTPHVRLDLADSECLVCGGTN